MNLRIWLISCTLLMFIASASVFAEGGMTSPEAKAGSPANWEYITAYGGTGNWHIRKLRAKVRRTGTSVTIEAYDDGGRVAERIAGTLQGNRFKGKRNIIFSEPLDEPVEGTYSQVKDGNRLYEVFTMSNQFSLLGVSRATNRN